MDNSTPGRAGRPPGIRTRPDGLTSRQAAIVSYMTEYVARHGYPPPIREIGGTS
ncbi:hypothetical protein ACFYRN_41415 [Streptomyces sp. NPDC005227]|uniref:LexA family protein n=1 Tax=unclassified Streptomyces TaxID=2593676 RepID=UPI0036B61D76